METKKQNKNFFLHVYEGFLAQPLPTKLFIIALLIIALAIPALVSPILVKAESPSISLNPIDDGYVNKSSTKSNYGDDSKLKSDKDRTAYLKFNLSSLSGQPVSKAELRLYVSDSSRLIHQIKNVPDTNWSEKTLTYNNRPTSSSTIIASIAGKKSKEWQTVDVTNEVKSHLGNMWAISIQNPPGDGDSLYFYSKDDNSRKPELVIQLGSTSTTPVPTITTTPVTPIKSPTPTITGVRTPTPIKTATPTLLKTPTPTPYAGQATYPGQILNLNNWKITLPTGNSESPTEIKQPTLATYKIDPWFVVNSEGNGVRFRASVKGVTTSGSGYPRSELREMTNNGSANASWSSSSGVHTMILEEAVTAVPQTKKHVVAGQIHDANDDVIVIRLEYPKLFIDINGADGPVLDANYTLGKKFTVKFEVSNGKTNIYYNNSTTPAYILTKSYSGAYFKAGAYTQSNCGTESSSLCNDNNYGEVVVYKATVTHQ